MSVFEWIVIALLIIVIFFLFGIFIYIKDLRDELLNKIQNDESTIHETSLNRILTLTEDEKKNYASRRARIVEEELKEIDRKRRKTEYERIGKKEYEDKIKKEQNNKEK